MDNYIDVKDRLMQISELAADEIIRRCMPQEDEISENLARQLYGDKWVRKMRREGKAHVRTKGRITAFSRKELDKLRHEEREPVRIIFKAKK